MEVEADSLVLWRKATGAKPGGVDLSAAQEQGVSDIYVTGNVVFRQGQRTIRAKDMYYDLQNQRAVANDVVFKTFDPTRDVPIYIRAKQLRQMAANEFEGDEIVVTTSEFWKPQISLEAARIRITDDTQEVELGGIVPDSTFNVELRDVRFRYGNVTLLALPKVHANRERPDLPIRSIHAGYDNTFGASLETRWYLNRLLGLREPEGTNSTLSLDYYGKRGPGGGVEVDYERENYFGSFLGYVIDDHGEDRLSRTRKDVDVPEDLRGRLRLQHRQYLPYGWQLTAEVSYLSDQNFLEQFYRTEYNVGKEQETLLYLKRIQDNWGLAFLGKVRTNDFLDQVEELPSAEYHLTGQSLFDDLFTFYSDNQVSQYRYRTSSGNPVRVPDDYFLFTGTRNELDLPLTVGRAKIVPFVAGTFGYDDGAGFQAGIDNEPAPPENASLDRRRGRADEHAALLVRLSRGPVPSVGSVRNAACHRTYAHGREVCRQRRCGGPAGCPGLPDCAAVADEAGTASEPPHGGLAGAEYGFRVGQRVESRIRRTRLSHLEYAVHPSGGPLGANASPAGQTLDGSGGAAPELCQCRWDLETDRCNFYTGR